MTIRLPRTDLVAVIAASAALLSLLQPQAAAAQPAGLRVEKGSQLEVRFVGYPWRPDIFQGFEEGGANARSWAFARLVASSSFALDGTRLVPGHYAMVLNPKTGTLPMTLELRRTSASEFLLDVPERPAPPAGESVYKRSVTFKPGSEPTPVLDVTIASWAEGSLLTIRYGDRKLVLELPRASPY
jgi:hypothetical protein